MKLELEEYKKFGFLSIILSLIVGIYWLLRPIKDAVFTNTVGVSFLPYAKIISAFFLIPIILLYSKLIDIFKKQQLFYIIVPLYGIFFFAVAFLLNNYNWQQNHMLSWAIYLGIESFILLVYALFWSFVSSITSATVAQKRYPIIVAGAQIGTIIGSEFAKHASQLGIPWLIFIGAVGICLIPILVIIFIKLYSHNIDYCVQKKSTGLIEGLKLLISKPYLVGILGIATLGCIVVTILELALIFKVKETYQATTKIVEFLGLYGQSINLLTLIFSLFCTKFIIKKCGFKLSLSICPAIVGILVFCVLMLPSLWMLFVATVIIKCVLYGLNNPCKEMAYINTSDDIKFKTKGWIDTIGYRVAESIGGIISIIFPIMSNLFAWGFGSFIVLGVVMLWGIATVYVGQKNLELVQNSQIIE